MQSGNKLDGAIIKEIRVDVEQRVLDVKSAAILARTCKFFKNEITASKYWKEAKRQHDLKQSIRESKVPEELFEQVVRMNVIHDYENLSIACNKLNIFRGMIENTWELLVLSGEPKAIQYAIQNQLVKENTMNRWQENPLHVAVFSGKVAAVKAVMAAFDIDPDTLTKANINLYCLAAWRGDIEMVHYLHFLHQQGKLHHTPSTVPLGGVDAFQHARMYSRKTAPLIQQALAIPDLEMIATFKEQQESKEEQLHFSRISS